MPSSLVSSSEVAVEVNERPPTLESVYREHFQGVWRLLRRLGVPIAVLDDAAQDVFLVVHRKLADFDPRAPLRSWVFAITVRVASEYRRRAARRRAECLDDGLPDRAPSPAELGELREEVQLLHQILGELDDDKRMVFVLSELEQLTVPEIAAVTGVNLNTVYSRLRAARKYFDAELNRRRAAARWTRATAWLGQSGGKSR
jgi:RNA polymerase sigma-70 factor (ECF subfamily)